MKSTSKPFLTTRNVHLQTPQEMLINIVKDIILGMNETFVFRETNYDNIWWLSDQEKTNRIRLDE